MSAQEDAAIAIAIETNLLQVCPIHEDSIIGGGSDDLLHAYKLASERFKAGDPDLTRLFSSQKELTDCIKEVVEMSAEDECGSCSSPGVA
jgi:hypothetical protein